MRASPDRADVVVIGGGIVGCATAYYLARRGAAVVLVEKGEVASEQSGRAWGFVRQQGRDPHEMPLMLASNAIWRSLSRELDADVEWVQGGNLALAQDEGRVEQFREWLGVAREFGLDTRVLSRRELTELVPGMEGPWTGGMYTASDGHAEPWKATIAFAGAALEKGAVIYTRCAAEGIDVAGGRVSAVLTERGAIRTPVVVCAAGAWSSAVARMVGLSLPQRVVRATVAETTSVRPVTAAGIWAPGIAVRQRPTGSFYIAGGGHAVHDVTLQSFRHLRLFLPNYVKNRGLLQVRVGAELVRDLVRSLPGSPASRHPFAHTVGAEPWPDLKGAAHTLANFEGLFPALAGIGIRRVWAGRIDATPDAVPVLGEADRPRGFVFATGFSGHGFAMGPIAGRLVSELILDGEPSLDIRPLRFNRFREGDLAKPRNVL